MGNDKLLDKISWVATVLIVFIVLLVYDPGNAQKSTDWIDGMVAGGLLSFVFYLPVKIAVYIAAIPLTFISDYADEIMIARSKIPKDN